MNDLDCFKSPRSWIPGIAKATAIAIFALAAPIACVSSDQGDGEKATGALGAFAPWANLSAPKGQDGAPTIVQVGSQQVAFSASINAAAGASGGLAIYSSSKTSGAGGAAGSFGSWSPWVALTSSGTEFKEPPAVVAFDVPSGTPLFGMIALVGRKSDDTYYVRIQNSSGSNILQNWTAIGGLWTSAAAIGFIPANSKVGPQSVLIIVGRGPDLRYWGMTNALLSGSVYSHSNWSAPGAVYENQTFTSAPTITYACPGSPFGYSMILAGANNSTVLIKAFYGVWQPWVQAPFVLKGGTGPALAVGCPGSGGEVTIYGLGADNRIYVSSVQGQTANNWNSIGTTVFTAVSATGSSSKAIATGKTGVGTAPDFQAMVTSATSP